MAIEVEYFIESEDMTDEQYNEQEYKTITISTQYFYEYIASIAEDETGEQVCRETFYYKIV